LINSKLPKELFTNYLNKYENLFLDVVNSLVLDLYEKFMVITEDQLFPMQIIREIESYKEEEHGLTYENIQSSILRAQYCSIII